MNITPHSWAEEPEVAASRHLDAALIVRELADQAAEVRRSAAYVEHGHVAKTLAKYPHLRMVLLAMRAGAALGEHHARGAISIQVLSGRVRLDLPGRALELPAGFLATLESSVPHDLRALEDSDVLLSIGWGGGDA